MQPKTNENGASAKMHQSVWYGFTLRVRGRLRRVEWALWLVGKNAARNGAIVLADDEGIDVGNKLSTCKRVNASVRPTLAAFPQF